MIAQGDNVQNKINKSVHVCSEEISYMYCTKPLNFQSGYWSRRNTYVPALGLKLGLGLG